MIRTSGRTASVPTDASEGPAAWNDAKASARATKASNTRKASGRRRRVDPTTCDRDYSVAELKFMGAMREYKRQRADVPHFERAPGGPPGARLRQGPGRLNRRDARRPHPRPARVPPGFAAPRGCRTPCGEGDAPRHRVIPRHHPGAIAVPAPPLREEARA